MAQAAKLDRDGATPRTRYEDDLYTWVGEQVALLRAGRIDEIDAENIAEELGDVGKSEHAKLQSALAVLLSHMLKWDHQPNRRCRSWDNTITTQRRHYADVLADNPGLKSRRASALARAYGLARLDASSETNLPLAAFPGRVPLLLDGDPGSGRSITMAFPNGSR